MLLEAVCGCDIDVPVVLVTERLDEPGFFGVRLRLFPAEGRTWAELEAMLLTDCDACVEL